MSLSRPAPTCAEISFTTPFVLEPPAQVALEDYARTLGLAAGAEARLTESGAVEGVHLCGLSTKVTPAVQRDVEDFARELASTSPGGGLGWS